MRYSLPDDLTVMAPKGKRSQLPKDSGGVERNDQSGRAYITLGKRRRHGPWRASVVEARADLAHAQQSASKDEAASYLVTLTENVHKADETGSIAYEKGKYRARLHLHGSHIQGPWRSLKGEASVDLDEIRAAVSEVEMREVAKRLCQLCAEDTEKEVRQLHTFVANEASRGTSRDASVAAMCSSASSRKRLRPRASNEAAAHTAIANAFGDTLPSTDSERPALVTRAFGSHRNSPSLEPLQFWACCRLGSVTLKYELEGSQVKFSADGKLVAIDTGKVYDAVAGTCLKELPAGHHMSQIGSFSDVGCTLTFFMEDRAAKEDRLDHYKFISWNLDNDNIEVLAVFAGVEVFPAPKGCAFVTACDVLSGLNLWNGDWLLTQGNWCSSGLILTKRHEFRESCYRILCFSQLPSRLCHKTDGIVNAVVHHYANACTSTQMQQGKTVRIVVSSCDPIKAKSKK